MKIKNNVKNGIIISFFIIITNYSQNFKVEEKDEDEDDNYKPDNNSIYCEEKFESYTEAFDKAKDFINNNLKGILLNTQKIKLSTKPNVSIVIPCYNCTKYILKAIRSIQNQDLSNFEIIIVNDASTDDSLKYIEQLQKEESRIEIVKNIKIWEYYIQGLLGHYQPKVNIYFLWIKMIWF